MSEVEEILEQIRNQKGVEGYVIADRRGVVIRQSPRMQAAESEKYALYMRELAWKARNVVRDLDPKNSMEFMRIRLKKLEFLIASEKEYLVVVMQKWTPAAEIM